MNNGRLLAVVRKIRTFSLVDSCRMHPYLWYFSMFCIFVCWANYKQYKRLAPLYPNLATYHLEHGEQLMSMKKQELAEVTRYNEMVHSMRQDISHKE